MMENTDNLVLEIGGEVVPSLLYFSWAVDADNYASGVIRYEVENVPGPRIQEGLQSLVLRNGSTKILDLKSVQLAAELGTLNQLEGWMEIEVRWYAT